MSTYELVKAKAAAAKKAAGKLAITNTVSENAIGQATVLDMNTKNMILPTI